jgi:sarcosine dehydrogenase
MKKRMASFLVADPDALLFGRESIYRDGRLMGWLTSPT